MRGCLGWSEDGVNRDIANIIVKELAPRLVSLDISDSDICLQTLSTGLWTCLRHLDVGYMRLMKARPINTQLSGLITLLESTPNLASVSMRNFQHVGVGHLDHVLGALEKNSALKQFEISMCDFGVNHEVFAKVSWPSAIEHLEIGGTCNSFLSHHFERNIDRLLSQESFPNLTRFVLTGADVGELFFRRGENLAKAITTWPSLREICFGKGVSSRLQGRVNVFVTDHLHPCLVSQRTPLSLECIYPIPNSPGAIHALVSAQQRNILPALKYVSCDMLYESDVQPLCSFDTCHWPNVKELRLCLRQRMPCVLDIGRFPSLYFLQVDDAAGIREFLLRPCSVHVNLKYLNFTVSKRSIPADTYRWIDILIDHGQSTFPNLEHLFIKDLFGEVCPIGFCVPEYESTIVHAWKSLKTCSVRFH